MDHASMLQAQEVHSREVSGSKLLRLLSASLEEPGQFRKAQ